MEKITIESILSWFKKAIEGGIPISPATWLDSAGKLVILSEEIDERIATAEALMADYEMILIKEGKAASAAKILKKDVLKGEYTYRHLLSDIALRSRIDEHIRLAKKRQDIKDF